MTASEPRIPDDFSDVEEIERGSGRLRVGLEILLALFILVGIYYLFAPEEKAELPPLQPQEIDPIIRAQIAEPTGDRPTEPLPRQAVESPSAAAPPVDGETARGIIAALRAGTDSRSQSELNRLAREYQQQGRVTDAYLLWFYTARQGDGEAAFALAGLYDPNHFEAGNSPLSEADVTQAFKWYKVAAQHAVPHAAERLQALRSSLEERADAGDMSARRQLLNWQ